MVYYLLKWVSKNPISAVFSSKVAEINIFQVDFITHQMLIEPFSLGECRKYFQEYGFGYSDREVAECYMVFGGVPFYLSLMDKEESVTQNVDRLLFAPTGELRSEKSNLFRSLFKHSEDYVSIIEALSSKGKGLTRNELLE